MGWWKRRLPKRRWKRVCLYIFSGLLILLAADMMLVQYWRRITIGRDTTRITSPLNDRGTPDYVAALNTAHSAGVTLDNNAAPALLKIVGTSRGGSHYPAWWLKQALPAIGLAPEEIRSQSVEFIPWMSDQQPRVDKGQINAGEEAVRTILWRDADHPLWARWLKEQQPAVTAAWDATAKPRYYIPFIADAGHTQQMFEGLALRLSSERMLSSLLISDAMHAAAAGDALRCERDLTASLHLARLLTQGSTLIEYLVAMVIESRTWSAVPTIAGSSAFSSADVTHLLATLDVPPPFPRIANIMDVGERYFGLDFICASRDYGWGSMMSRTASAENPSFGMRVMSTVSQAVVPVHFNELLRQMNRHYDDLIAAENLPTYAERRTAMDRLQRRAEAFAHRPLIHRVGHFGDILSSFAIPSLGHTDQYIETASVQRQLGHLSLALRLYAIDHDGHYPDTLAPLASALHDVPLDPFINATFHYRVLPGGYVLYSVGPNEKDDGGVDRKHSKGDNYDLVVRVGD